MKWDYLTAVCFLLMTSIAIIGVPAYGYVVGYHTIDWIMLAVLYAVSGLGITVGYHRLVAHRSFDCPDWVKACFLVAGGWAFQNSARVWAADHIRHHARCDTKEDPYNAKRGFWHSHCGWLFYHSPYRYDKYEVTLRRDRVVMWQDRYYVPILVSGFALPFAVGLLSGGWQGAVSCLLLAGVGRTFLVLNSTFCINSICHLWGSQPHGQQDSSRDSWWISLLTFGEGYHNYHHTHLRDYRNGPQWYNFDPSKWLIFILAKIGLASNLFVSQPQRVRS